VAKPHPHCFERLANELRLEPREILYVGDDPWLDVGAARAAGFSTAWMNRRERQWPTEIAAPDIAVTDCAELAAILEP
jgi:putative hydrolase of the HAD superfamily